MKVFIYRKHNKKYSSETDWEDVEYSDIPEPPRRKKKLPNPPRHYVVERPAGGEWMEREEAAARSRSYFSHWRFWAALSACMLMGYLISRTVAWGLDAAKKDSLLNLTIRRFGSVTRARPRCCRRTPSKAGTNPNRPKLPRRSAYR